MKKVLFFLIMLAVCLQNVSFAQSKKMSKAEREAAWRAERMKKRAAEEVLEHSLEDAVAAEISETDRALMFYDESEEETPAPETPVSAEESFYALFDSSADANITYLPKTVSNPARVI